MVSNELRVGEWYRCNDWIFIPKSREEISCLDSTVLVFTGFGILISDNQVVIKKNMNFYQGVLREFKPLETLTPKEALILLAHGFELYRNGYIFKVNHAGCLVRCEEGDNWYGENAQSNFDNFTIHALPEESNG